MALELFDATQEKNKKERIIIYGAPGTGKSRLWGSLTPRFGNILMLAGDDNSEFLDSISREKRARIWPVIMRGDDAISNFQTFCETDWKGMEGRELPDGRVFPKIDTIVVDTYTSILERTLQITADQQLAGAEKHFKIQVGPEEFKIIPNRGDYRGNDSLSVGFLDALCDKQRDMHIILVCHEVLKYIEDVCVGGGPAHPGRRMLTELPGRFSTVIRLIKDEILVGGTTENVVIAVTDNDGRWIAKVRTDNEETPNPLGRVVLDRDPVNFWKAYDAIYAPKEAVNE